MNKSRAAVTVRAVFGKMCSIVGYVGSLFMFALIVIPYEAYLDNDAIAVFFTYFILIAIFAFFVMLIVAGAKTKRQIKRFKQYIALISASQVTSMSAIADNTKRSPDFVRKDIQQMIKRRFFTRAFIDAETDCIVIGGVDRPAPAATAGAVPPPGKGPVAMESVQCTGCGASNSKEKGSSGVCEYCGSPI